MTDTLPKSDLQRQHHLPPSEYFSYAEYVKNLEDEIRQEELCMESHRKRILELKGKLPKGAMTYK